MLFLHESSVARHMEYYNNLMLKISILKKSVPELRNATVYDLDFLRLQKAVAEECSPLMWEAELHRVWFSSFSNVKFPPSLAVRRKFGSEAVFLNKIYRMGMDLATGFVSVGIKEGKICLFSCEKYDGHRKNGVIILAIDVSEHAYYGDFGFDKDRYLREALTYLDLSLLN